MKVILAISFTLLLVLNSLYPQDTIRIYYDKDWEIISDKNAAEFYRIAYLNKDKLWVANDYYKSHKIQMTGFYKTKDFEIKHGEFIYYYEDGTILSKCKFINDKYEGLWTSWHENGVIKSEGNYLNNLTTGDWNFWYDNGQKKSEGKFISGLEVGVWRHWYENGVKKSEGNFTNGKQNGTFNFWFPNGQLQEIDVWRNGIIVSNKGYFDNGKIKYSGGFLHGKANGVWTYWNIDGQIYMKGQFINGFREGEWIRYFREGQMKVTFNYGYPKGEMPGGIITYKKDG